MQYQLLMKVARIEGTLPAGQKATIPMDLFRHLLIKALRAKGEFDPQFYLATNADVREAIRQRRIESAEVHYYTTGYFEHRMPKKFLVDEHYYLTENPDVADAMKKGKIRSAQEHFDHAGFLEGRAPFKDFSLF
jgi:hypothetical protein